MILIGVLLSMMAACGISPQVSPTPEPIATATRLPRPPRNNNVEALTGAQAAVGQFVFGLAPLLREKDTRLKIDLKAGGESVVMRYPPQPEDPTAWLTVDSFVLSYAMRQKLLADPQVQRVTLGQFGVSSTIENSADRFEHTAAWVSFADGTQAIVDLSPLSTNFAARHIPETMLSDELALEGQFEMRRAGVDLDQLLAMQVISQNGQTYLLLAKVEVTYNQYVFSLRLHPVQKADPMRPMEFLPGLSASVDISRSEFAALQQLAKTTGKSLFSDQPDLLTWQGAANPAMTAIMDDNLDLLWHMVTKFEHVVPDPLLPTPTPPPTATATPSPTPSPTATPRKLPLLTS